MSPFNPGTSCALCIQMLFTCRAENHSRIPSGLRRQIFPSFNRLMQTVKQPRLSNNSMLSTSVSLSCKRVNMYYIIANESFFICFIYTDRQLLNMYLGKYHVLPGTPLFISANFNFLTSSSERFNDKVHRQVCCNKIITCLIDEQSISFYFT